MFSNLTRKGWNSLRVGEVATTMVKWTSCGVTESGPIEIRFLRVSRELTVDKREGEMRIVKKSDEDRENGRSVHTLTFSRKHMHYSHP
jgi:hypothetical protein